MRCTRILLLPAVVFAVVITPNLSRAQDSGYAVTERGANYQVWQTTTVENGVNRVHSYLELATGLNYTNVSGQYVPSREQITVLAQGGAVAVQGQHQVYFPADIYNGVIDVITPDGRELRSRPLGVSYDDGTNTVFIATLTNSIGWLVSSNQVIYTNAFSGLKADLVCTYRKSGFECDLVFRQQPPKPGRYGLSNARSTVQLVTEFFNTADPQTLPGQTNAAFGLQDSTLKFGQMTMMQGKAFAISGSGNQTNLQSRLKAGMTSVYKRWIHAGGRTFLIEEVPLVRLTNDLAALPLTASTAVPDGQRLMASSHREFPAAHGLLADTNQMLLAAADLNRPPGVVLDYVTVNSGGDYTFQGGTTYYVSGPCYFGNVTFNGGAVLKYPSYYSTTAFISVSGTLTCNTTGTAPAIFTAYDDNTVGQTLPYSSGYPSGNFYANPAVYAPGPGANISLSNVQINYAEEAVGVGDDSSITLTDAQVNNCQIMAMLGLGDGCDPMTLTCNNCLCNAPYYGIFVYDNNSNGGDSYNLTNCTLNNVYYLVIASSYYDPDQISAVNCIFASSSLTVEGYCTWSGSYNGFYYASSFGSPATTSTSNPFQTSGSDGFYLASGSTFRNAGTTGISSTLLTDLQTRTTYTLSSGGWPDTDTPDLGWHYALQDSDNDGLPDWWEMYWFGNLTHSGGDLDANGYDLLTDYDNYLAGTPTDPNIIAFTIATTNNYVNTNHANVQLNILAGVPSYYAVFVGSSTTTNWLAFTTTNLTVSLGSTDGVYDVSVGLKGYATNATQTWNDYTITLDRVAPVLTITNPVIAGGTATVIIPYLQLQGYANEQLSSLSYDISNALGVVTNQNAFVTDQAFDPTLLDFTTNYFQCYDIPLTNGVNNLTFRVTDRAGNTTTTNFNVVLDYSTAMNPVVKLTWPTNGMQICQSTFTLRGWVDDPTATVVASITDTNGDTNIISGEVERSGVLWAENLPLAEGTNYLTLWVTNAAGLSNTTNICVVKNDMTLCVTNIDGNLWQPVVNVSGFISDASYAVYVNGVQGTNNGDGTWSATNVPVSTSGVASFDLSAVNGGDPNANTNVEKQPYWFIAQYHEDKITVGSGEEGGISGLDTYTRHKDYQTCYSTNNLGFLVYRGTVSDAYNDITYGVPNPYYWETVDITWWTAAWLNPMAEEKFANSNPYYQDELYPNLWWDTDAQVTGLPDEDLAAGTPGGQGSPTWAYHYYAQNAHYHHHSVSGTDHWDTDFQVPTARTKVLLLTGGKAGVARQNLWGINVSATENSWNAQGGWQVDDVADKTQLQVMKKHADADGNVWLLLPDGSTPIDITVTAPGEDYSADASPTKYCSYFEVFVDQPEPGTHKDPIYDYYGGHAFFRYYSDAPDEVLQRIHPELLPFENNNWGFYPQDGEFWGTADGYLGDDSPHHENVSRVFYIGYPQFIAGLTYTKKLHDTPPLYSCAISSWGYSCVYATYVAGFWAGISLPSAMSDVLPQNFGADILLQFPGPPDDDTPRY